MSELEDLRAEVQRLAEQKAEWRESAHHNKRQWIAAVERAESAGANHRALREAVKALADEWDRAQSARRFPSERVQGCARSIRALLASSLAEGTGEAGGLVIGRCRCGAEWNTPEHLLTPGMHDRIDALDVAMAARSRVVG